MGVLTEEELFAAALQKPPAERSAFLQRACGDDALLQAQVEALLAAHDHPDSLFEGAAYAPTLGPPPSETKVLGTRIGPYKLLQQIGEGGMGVVYMAEQTHPVQRRVALKLIKPGLDTRQVIARFEAERQALALMDHPNIAKVLDAGTTESGQPYFVMELVNGLPLTKFCDERRLTPRERLELFIPVCQAVQHAHQKGIIHRDLKPSNVVVALYDGKPVPKVIDFGVAKATGSKLTDKTMFTEFGALVGTLEYMSPEQAERNQVDIDTRSDIYSLGVLLYELLTGTTPLDKKRLKGAAILELMRIIKEIEPPKPSTRLSTTEELPSIAANRSLEPKRLSGLVRGDLDWIVMKALEKDRNRRYETVNGFAADLRRYLDHEPVEACPPSAAYRLKKFVRRNRAALATTGLVAVALFVGTAVSIWQAIEATRSRQLADERLELANERLERETKAVKEAVVQSQRADEHRRLAEANFQMAREAVDQMLTRVADEKLARIPGVEPVRKELLEQALQFYEQFLAQRRDDTHLQFETAKATQRVGLIKFLLCDWPGSAQALDKAIIIADTQLRDSPDDVKYLELLAESCAKHGNALVMVAGPRTIEVLDHGLAAIGRLQQLVPNNIGHQRIAGELHLTRGELYMYSGQHDQESIDSLSIASQIHRQLFAEDGQKLGDRARLMWNLLKLGDVVARRDFDHGDRLLAEAVELGESLPAPVRISAPDTIYGDPINALAVALLTRANHHIQRKRGDVVEQEAWLRRAITLLNAHLAAHPKAIHVRHCWGGAMCAYAGFLATVGRTDEAERLYRDMCRELLVNYKHDYHYQVSSGIGQLTAILQKSGRQDNKELATFKLQFYENLDAYPMNSYILKRRAAFRFELRKYRESLEDLAAAVEKNPSDISNLIWIPPLAVAACPDESFRTGVLALADKTIELTNGLGEAYVTRAALHLAMGNLSAARKDLDASIPSPTTGVYTRYQHALLCLALNDETAYRDDCTAMLRQFHDSQDPDELHFTVWTAVLVPDAVANRDEAIELARRAVEVGKESQQSLQGLGAVLFRAGRLQEAREALEHSGAAPANDNTSSAYGLYFLAMTHFKMGQPVAARQWYDKAVESTEKILGDAKSASTQAVPWNRKLTLELLRREAHALIQPDDPNAPADAAAVESANVPPPPALPE